MPRVADYSIVADAWTNGGEIEFTIPDNFEPSNRCVLTFMLRSNGLDDVRVTLRLNGNRIWDWRFGEDDVPAQAFQEVVAAGIARAGKNVLSFDINSGPASLELSDVVFWWQANI